MFFWFKKKPVVLDCFTSHLYCYDRFPITKATKHIPQWYKNLSKGNYTDPNKPHQITMKNCSGFIDYFSNSFAIPMWDYAHFRADSENVDIVCESVRIDEHPRHQYEGFLNSTYRHIKINTPWLIHSKSKVKFIQTRPLWCCEPRHQPERILHAQGVTDFYYQNSTNFNGFIKKPEPGESARVITLEPGTPLVFYTPLEDVNITLKLHLIKEDEYNSKLRYISPTGGPSRLKLNRLNYDKAKSKKCPFS